MKNFLTYNELHAMKALDSEISINESFKDIKILAVKSKKALIDALKIKLGKLAPGLADDKTFVEQLADSFSYEVEE